MTYPVNSGGGVPSLSGTFIPEIWSGKLVEKLYANTCYEDIANTDYEGEIKASGDKVNIRTIPTLTIRDYVKGTDLTYENPQSGNVELLIDKGHYFAFSAYDLDRIQSDINLMDTWANDANQQMKIKVDTNVLGSVYADVAAENAGSTAGAKSGDINLGTTAAPLAFTKSTALDILTDYGTVLDEQNVPDEGRYIVLTPRLAGAIKKSDLKDASITGDGKSTLRTGRLGMIDRFTLYTSNNLHVASGKTDVIFGHKKALTFAGQYVNMETLKNPKDFGDLVRGLMIYGFEVIDPKAIGHSVVTVS